MIQSDKKKVQNPRSAWPTILPLVGIPGHPLSEAGRERHGQNALALWLRGAAMTFWEAWWWRGEVQYGESVLERIERCELCHTVQRKCSWKGYSEASLPFSELMSGADTMSEQSCYLLVFLWSSSALCLVTTNQTKWPHWDLPGRQQEITTLIKTTTAAEVSFCILFTLPPFFKILLFLYFFGCARP